MAWLPEVDWADVPSADGSVPGERIAPFGPQPPVLLELRMRGWQPLIEQPRWSFVPWVWPDPDRTWIHDRVQRWHIRQARDGTVVRTRWGRADYRHADAELADACRRAGTTPRPGGRLWLLRGPSPALCIDTVIDLIERAALRRGVALTESPDLTMVAVGVIGELWGRAHARVAG